MYLFTVNLWLSDHWVHYINSYMAAASTRVNRSHISLSTVGQAPCEGFSTNWHKLSHRLMIDHWNSVFICVPTISRCSSCHHPVLLICNVFVCLDVTCLHFVHQWNFFFLFHLDGFQWGVNINHLLSAIEEFQCHILLNIIFFYFIRIIKYFNTI